MKTHIRQQCSNLVSSHWEKNETEKKRIAISTRKKEWQFQPEKRIAISTIKKEWQFQPHTEIQERKYTGKSLLSLKIKKNKGRCPVGWVKFSKWKKTGCGRFKICNRP